jgi:hypothetical protein
MIRRSTAIALLVLTAWQTPTLAQDEKLDAISALGDINGIALHCNGLAQTQKIKRELVLTLPKRRQLGELFDYATNKSFMAFIEQNSECPSQEALAQRVDKALQRLKAAYDQP